MRKILASNCTGRFSHLGQPDPWRHEVILQLVAEPRRVTRNRCHVDLTVEDVDAAIGQFTRLGGAVKKEPSIYPRPGSFPGKPPVIDWAVMTDPSATSSASSASS